MRHGLTLGELGWWFIKTLNLDLDYRVIEMEGWTPQTGPGYGWPLGERPGWAFVSRCFFRCCLC